VTWLMCGCRPNPVVPLSPIFAEPSVSGCARPVTPCRHRCRHRHRRAGRRCPPSRRAWPHPDAGVAAAADPTLIQVPVDVTVTVRGAHALLAEAGRQVDVSRANLTDETTASASVAVAVATVAAVRASPEASTVLVELGGTRRTSATENLSRNWRDARTHTWLGINSTPVHPARTTHRHVGFASR
jgi:alkylation response protein AidB-like acyl-CoA dehydrogenase